MPEIKARKPKELKPDELKWTCDPAKFEFDSTSEIKPLEGILGQERAIKALKLGVDLRSQGYNIFITGLSGTGKFSTVKGMLETISPDNTTIFDYAYVNNFEDTDRPTLIKFPAGKGKKFKRNMASAIKFLQENIPMLLESDAFTAQKKKLINDYGQNQQLILTSFESKLRKDNFALGQIKVGEMSRPEIMLIIDDKPI